MRYEAKDMKNGIVIYTGDSRSGFILSLIEYVEAQRQGHLNWINEEDIFRLNVKALDRVGIRISFINVIQQQSKLVI